MSIHLEPSIIREKIAKRFGLFERRISENLESRSSTPSSTANLNEDFDQYLVVVAGRSVPM